MKHLIESDKRLEEIVNGILVDNVHPVSTHEVTKKIDQVIINQGLTRDDFDRDRVPMGANWEIKYEIYVDKKMFDQIIGELQSHRVQMRGFNYDKRKELGWILPEVRDSELNK